MDALSKQVGVAQLRTFALPRFPDAGPIDSELQELEAKVAIVRQAESDYAQAVATSMKARERLEEVVANFPVDMDARLDTALSRLSKDKTKKLIKACFRGATLESLGLGEHTDPLATVIRSRAKVADLEGEIWTLKQSATIGEQERRGLQEAVHSLEAVNSELRSKGDQLEAEIAGLKKTIRGLNADVEEI